MRKMIGILLLWSLAAVGMAGDGNDQGGNQGGNSQGGNNNCQGTCNDPPTAAPEIDPAGAASALTLLAGALVVLRGRREKK